MYTARARIQFSRKYQLERGLREGCPSSCVAFNLQHDAALSDYQRRAAKEVGEEGSIRFRSDVSAPLDWFFGAKQKRLVQDGWLETVLDILTFADDTTQVNRSAQRRLEELMQQVLADWGETIHPGKTARMRVEQNSAPEMFAENMEFLGGWPEQGGSTREDTYERIEASRRLWYLVNRRLPWLQLSLQLQGQIIRATVLASLLYGCETRPWTATEVDIVQRFVNRVLQRVALRGKPGGMRDMKRKLTQTDLRLSH